MLEVLMGIGLPMVIFGVFALLSMWLGAETRPWFDERPVRNDRPNWFPIARRLPSDDELAADEPPDGAVVPVPAPAAPRQASPAAVTRAATSPAGV